jgi:hypothetical protein
MTLMKGSATPDSGRGGGGVTRRVYDSSLVTEGVDATGETGRVTLTERCSVPSSQPGVCFVIEDCSEKTGRNPQGVMGRG